ncbi:unnamed protein product [Clavelina lepadiformis]|uniref:Arf-GAP domain-containing protein n=1 Tax=Clavelina lepadiformis TaxID=159417 RepID=A0ABP0F9Q7_CLALP
MASSRKKQEERHLQTLKDALKLECNKRCFECDQRGPTYVDVTIGSFVCTSCGGILRGLNPPHRIKSVSMATFSPSEIAFVETRGNAYCKNIYLGKYDSRSNAKPESKGDHAKLKYFMEQKYEQKKWYIPPEQAQKPTESFMNSVAQKSDKTKPLTTLLGSNAPPLKVEKKPTSPKQVQKIDNMLADVSISSNNSASTNQLNGTDKGGFADFSNAFSSSSSFDAFGDFTSSQNSSNPTSSSSTNGFAQFPNIMAPLSSTSNATISQPAAPSKPVDKYADLSGLFNLDDGSSTDIMSLWSSNSTSTSQNPNTSLFGMSQPQNTAASQQTSIFGNTQSQSNVFGNTNQQPSVFGTQTTTAYGNTPQPQSGLMNNMPAPPAYGNLQPAFGGMQPTMMTNAGFTTMPNAVPVFGSSPQQTSTGINVFGGMQVPATGYGMATQAAFPAQQTQPIMGTTQPVSAANPFMQAVSQQPAQAQMGANPFMSMQQTTQKPFQTQTAPTNPFMSMSSQAPLQQNPTSTNPFF